MNATRNEPARAGSIVSIAGAALLMLSIGEALGQPGGGGGRGGQRLDSAEQKAVWEIQAKGVAEDLELDEVIESKLVAAYQAARASHDEARRELWADSGGNRMAGWQQRRELRASGREKLQEALTAFLSDGQTEQAIGVLGAFSRRWDQWDQMVHVLSGFELEQEDLDKALERIQTYVAESNKAREEAMTSGDFMSIGESMRELKSKLDENMETLLTKEQFETWEEATARHWPGGPGFGGGPGRGRPNP